MLPDRSGALQGRLLATCFRGAALLRLCPPSPPSAACAGALSWLGASGIIPRRRQPGSAFHVPLAGAGAPAIPHVMGQGAVMIFMNHKLVSATGKSSGVGPIVLASSPLCLHASVCFLGSGSLAERAEGCWKRRKYSW